MLLNTDDLGGLVETPSLDSKSYLVLYIKNKQKIVLNVLILKASKVIIYDIVN